MNFNNNCDLKSFAKDLLNKLSRSNELVLVNEIYNWNSDVLKLHQNILGNSY